MKDAYNPIGIRTRDIPACSEVSKISAPQRTLFISVCSCNSLNHQCNTRDARYI